ncbi:MAG: hypothetical protein ACKVQV_16155 [Bacteroidia bacterium]
MANRAYMITMDKGGLLDTFDYTKFHKSLTCAKGVISWWHYLQSTYIIIVSEKSNAASVGKFIINNAPKKQFFVAKIDLNDHFGLLPKDAWDWINSQITPPNPKNRLA